MTTNPRQSGTVIIHNVTNAPQVVSPASDVRPQALAARLASSDDVATVCLGFQPSRAGTDAAAVILNADINDVRTVWPRHSAFRPAGPSRTCPPGRADACVRAKVPPNASSELSVFQVVDEFTGLPTVADPLADRPHLAHGTLIRTWLRLGRIGRQLITRRHGGTTRRRRFRVAG